MIQSIHLSKLSKKFKNDNSYLLDSIDFNFRLDSGKLYFIFGKSGQGKTTLFNILGTLDHPSKGEVVYKTDSDSFRWNPTTYFMNNKIVSLRRNFLRYIYQDFRLVECFTAMENIFSYANANGNEKSFETTFELLNKFFPKKAGRKLPEEIKYLYEQTREEPLERSFIKTMKWARKYNKKSIHLSGGEKQRVSLIRAVQDERISGKVFLADEPTGQVHFELKKLFFQFLLSLANKNIVLVVSHEVQNIESLVENNVENIIFLKLDHNLKKISYQSIKEASYEKK